MLLPQVAHSLAEAVWEAQGGLGLGFATVLLCPELTEPQLFSLSHAADILK